MISFFCPLDTSGHGRGVALIYSGWNTYLAQVAEVEVTGSGDTQVRRSRSKSFVRGTRRRGFGPQWCCS